MSRNIFKIIIVDDDFDDHYLIKGAIKELNFPSEIIALYNGLELFEYFNAHEKQSMRERIDFIIMDINMPAMNGISALIKLKKDPLLNSIPVFMLSTSRENSTYQECLKQGILDFYIKPNNSRDLKKIVTEMFEKVSVIN